MAIKQLNKTKKVVKAEKKVIPPPAYESSEQESDQSEQEDAAEDAEEDAEEETETTADKEVTKSENVTFKDLGLMQPLVDACKQLNFKAPTEIQKESIPWSLQGRDIIGLAQTGSGKTAAFALPILQALWNNPSPMFACVMAPTRELAVQISETFESLGSTIGVRCVVIVGGMDMMAQSIALSKKPHIIVCTPGRLQDHLENTKGFSLRTLKYLVLDEADRLLDMDFGPIIDQILKVIPKERNTFLFSATMTTKVAKLQRASLNNPVKVEVATKYSTVSTLLQYYLFFPLKQKDSYLVYLLNELAGNSTIVFSRTCNDCQRITLLLRNLGFPAIPLHGQLSQEKRLGALNKFKSGNRNILIATDVASRGLDIPSVDIVLNYDLPNNSKDYIHRVGRTARAGRSGKSITFVTQYDVEVYQRIEQALDKKLDEFPVDKDAVMLLQERVDEAQRFAITELKEQHASRGKGGRAGKRQFNSDDRDRDDDSVQAGSYNSKSASARGNRQGKKMRKCLPFIPPLADPSKTVSSLTSERALVSFPIEPLTQFLHGANLDIQRRIRAQLEQDPVFSNADKPFQSREGMYVRSLEKASKLVELRKKHKWGEDEMMLAMMMVGDSTPQFLHEALFIPTLKTQMSDEQLKIWLPRAENYEIFGCYAQTELAHGSNLRKLETTATYLPDSDAFELDTPTINSMKWWPGALARSSTHCVIYARLLLHGKDYGVHPFLLQIRAAGTHRPLPGIEIGDIGPKIGFNTIDNGFLRVNKVHIPRDQMCMRNARVSRQGEYETAKHAKMNYATMVAIRANIVRNAGFALGQALTVAIRYSMVRVQGGDRIPSQNGHELKVIDHGMQRYRLTTSLALSYAMLMTGRVMMDLHRKNLKNVAKGEVGLMAEVHATSSGLKALTSDLATAHVEDTRRACGGHGYSWLSGLPELYTTLLQDVTVEGENTILHLQTSRWLLKTVLGAIKSKDLSRVPSGLRPALQDSKVLEHETSTIAPGKPVTGEALIAAFWHREARVLHEVVSRIVRDGAGEEAMAKSQVRMVELSRTHGEGMLVRNFYEALAKEEAEVVARGGDPTKGHLPVLKMLAELHALHRLLEQAGDFTEDGYVNRQQIVWCKERRAQLVDLLRYELIGLVDAFDISDNQLNSAIGRYDGRVYESLYEWAKYGMSLQRKGSEGGVLGFDEVLKDVFAEGRRLNGTPAPKL